SAALRSVSRVLSLILIALNLRWKSQVFTFASRLGNRAISRLRNRHCSAHQRTRTVRPLQLSLCANCRNQPYLRTFSQLRHSSIGHQEIRHRDQLQHRAVTLQRLVHAAVLWSGRRELCDGWRAKLQKFVVGIRQRTATFCLEQPPADVNKMRDNRKASFG